MLISTDEEVAQKAGKETDDNYEEERRKKNNQPKSINQIYFSNCMINLMAREYSKQRKITNRAMTV